MCVGAVPEAEYIAIYLQLARYLVGWGHRICGQRVSISSGKSNELFLDKNTCQQYSAEDDCRNVVGHVGTCDTVDAAPFRARHDSLRLGVVSLELFTFKGSS